MIYGDCMAVVILLLLLSLLLVYDHHIIRIYSIIHLIFTIVKYSELLRLLSHVADISIFLDPVLVIIKN